MKKVVYFSQANIDQLCSPKRASMLIGKLSGRLGFTDLIPPTKPCYNQNPPIPEDYRDHLVLKKKDDIKFEPALINGISNFSIVAGSSYDNENDELPITEALINYHSSLIGRWHIGRFDTQGSYPKNYCFEPLAY